MVDLPDTLIPFTALTFDGASAAVMKGASHMEPEVIAALLSRVVRVGAIDAAGGKVEPVSVTVDVTGTPRPGADIRFTSKIDRRTRTIVFISGAATVNDASVLTATAVYRIPQS